MEEAKSDAVVTERAGWPIFSTIAGATLFLCLFTPFFLLTLPVMATVGLSIVAAFRREKPVWLPYLVGGLAVALVITSNSHSAMSTAGPTSASNSELYKDATWEYGSARDAMRGTTTQWASLNSPTDLQLSPPYDGPNTASIETADGGDLILTVTKGQLLCRSGDTVSIKFDGGPIYEYPCSTPDNGNSNTLYINSAYSHVTRQPANPVDGILGAKKMVVEVQFYQDGARQITFNVGGLDKSKA